MMDLSQRPIAGPIGLPGGRETEMLRQCIENAPVAIAILDTELKYVHVSQQWIQDYNLIGCDLLGRSHYEIFSDLPIHWKAVHQSVLEGAIIRREEEAFHRFDGTSELLQWEARPWFLENGQIGGMILYTQKRASPAKQSERLSPESGEFQHRLLRAQRLEGIGSLAGGIVHDLNNLLGPILLATDVLRTEMKAVGNQELLDAISLSALKGSKMLEKLLSYAKGERSVARNIQLKQVVADILSIVRGSFIENIRVQEALPEDLWSIFGDATEIRQVLLNLCINARDAMPNGGVLRISAQNIELPVQPVLAGGSTDRSCVLLSVEDTGSGMSEEVVERIFEPFYTTKEEGKGTGLGLFTLLSIVESHGGFIEVCSEVGRGSEFKVFFPAAVMNFSEQPQVETRSPYLVRGLKPQDAYQFPVRGRNVEVESSHG